MPAPLPLAAASQRLRKKPGRPRKHPIRPPAPPVKLSPIVLPQLFDKRGSANYIGVSVRTIERLLAAGTLHRVRIPLPNDAGELRKDLIARQELDDLVKAGRETT